VRFYVSALVDHRPAPLITGLTGIAANHPVAVVVAFDFGDFKAVGTQIEDRVGVHWRTSLKAADSVTDRPPKILTSKTCQVSEK
jgi:hypothetical protein